MIIELAELRQRLDHNDYSDAVTGDEADCCFNRAQAAKCRELVEVEGRDPACRPVKRAQGGGDEEAYIRRVNTVGLHHVRRHDQKQRHGSLGKIGETKAVLQLIVAHRLRQHEKGSAVRRCAHAARFVVVDGEAAHQAGDLGLPCCTSRRAVATRPLIGSRVCGSYSSPSVSVSRTLANRAANGRSRRSLHPWQDRQSRRATAATNAGLRRPSAEIIRPCSRRRDRTARHRCSVRRAAPSRRFGHLHNQECPSERRADLSRTFA